MPLRNGSPSHTPQAITLYGLSKLLFNWLEQTEINNNTQAASVTPRWLQRGGFALQVALRKSLRVFSLVAGLQTFSSTTENWFFSCALVGVK